MRKLFSILLTAVFMVPSLLIGASAATTHTVKSGESLWKIATKYQVGLSEIKSANPQIQNFDLIYPGQTIQIPTLDASITGYEQTNY